MAERKTKKKVSNNTVGKNDNRILEVRTTQTGALKQVFERIQSVISECCIVFIPPDENDSNIIDDYYESEEDEKPTKKMQKKKNTKIIEKKSKKNAGKNKSIKNKKKSKKEISESDSDSGETSETESDSESSSDSETKSKTKGKKKSLKQPIKEKTIPDNKKKNSGGIRILRLTQDKSVLIKLILDASNFEYFKCTEPKITIGIDMSQLHNMLKSINDNDPITLYMNRNNRSTLHIHSNSEHKEETDLEVYLMDIGNQEIPLPRAEFQNKITIASDKFHAICKQLNNTSVHVEITSVDNEIQFNGKNEGGKISRTYRDDNLKKKKGPTHVVQGVYELRNLMYFSKCNKLCQTIDMYLRNDFPLVLVISIATLGKMYIFLTPVEQNINN